jgi:hypothetical protein
MKFFSLLMLRVEPWSAPGFVSSFEDERCRPAVGRATDFGPNQNGQRVTS